LLWEEAGSSSAVCEGRAQNEVFAKVRVLAANKFYYLRGGAERYFFGLCHILEERGHQIIPFSMLDGRNCPSPYSEFFVSHIEFFEPKTLLQKLAAAQRVLYSSEAKRQIEALLIQTKPRIAHLHNIAHHISPSILHSLKKYGIPVVQTLHDYKLICPTYTLVSAGRICERCRKYRYYNVVLHRCNRGSLAASLLGCIEMYLHKLWRTYEKNVDLFISPSQFLRRKLVEYGFDEHKIAHLPNFIDADDYPFHYAADSDYFVFVGRLIPIKGVLTLLKAMEEVKHFRLLVVGEGYLRPELERYAEGEKLGVEFLGYKSGHELEQIIKGSLFTVVPSEWYENLPYAILEAFAMGKPVVGSDIGGIPELIEHGANGLLFKAGNAQDLASKIHYLLDHRQMIPEMGRRAREKVEKTYNPESHYQRIISIYNSLIQSG
jgi:glycosyltransferase involved in cell wall biosynthesis